MINLEDYQKFQEKYIKNSFEEIFFKNLKKIINSNSKSEKNLQKRIEKLMNTYLLKKSESKIEINPFWFSKLNIIFKSEIKELELNLPLILDEVELKEGIYRKIIKDPLFLIAEEIFIVFILSYIESYKDTSIKDKITDDMKQKMLTLDNFPQLTNDLIINNSTFISIASENLYNFLKYKFYVNFLEFFFVSKLKLSTKDFNQLAKLSNENSKKKTLYICNPDSLFEIYINQLNPFVNNPLTLEEKKLKLLNLKKNFNDFFSNYKKKNYIFTSKIIVLVKEFLIKKNFLSEFSIKNTKKNYMYLTLFDLQYYNELKSMIHLVSKIPMISIPKDWNYNGKNGGYLLDHLHNNININKFIKLGKSKIQFSKETIDSVNLLQKKTYNINKLYLSYCKTSWFREKKSFIKTPIQLFDSSFLNFQNSLSSFVNEYYHFVVDRQDQNKNFSDLKKFFQIKVKIINYYKDCLLAKKLAKLSEIEKDKLMELHNLNKSIIANFHTLKSLELIFFKELANYREYNFILKISDILIDKDLFTVSTLDFRGRIVPHSRLSRSSGIYKYLLVDKQTYIINKDDAKLLEEQISFLLYNKKKDFSKKSLQRYFYNNIDYEKFVYTKFNACKSLLSNLKQNFQSFFSSINHYIYIYNFLKLLIQNDNLQQRLNYHFMLEHIKLNEKIDVDTNILKILYNKFLNLEEVSDDINLNTFSDKVLFEYLSFLYEKIKLSDEKHLLIFSLLNYFNFKNCQFLKLNCFSNYLIEIDQNSSGPQIYSLISKDKTMAYLTNLFANPKLNKNDLYLTYLNDVTSNLNNNIEVEISKQIENLKQVKNNSDVLDLISDLKRFLEYSNKFFDRSFSKLIIMPKFYAMTNFGIFKLLDKLEFSEFSNIQYLKKILFNCIQDNLQKPTYKGVLNYQYNLCLLAGILYKKKLPINIKTFDGSLITYEYSLFKDVYAKIYRKNKPELSYRLFVPNEHKVIVDFSKKSIQSFPPNFIHSIDAALCRIIVSLFYKYTFYIIEPLHDSFRIPISYVTKLTNLIKYVYSYYFFNDYFHKVQLGLDNNSLLLTLNNESNYLKYKENFLQFENFDFNNLVWELFIKEISVSTTTKSEMRDLINKNTKPNFEEKFFYSFLKNDFMFYF